MTKILVRESVLREMIKKALLAEYSDNFHERRPGSLGNHQGKDATIAGIPSTFDLKNYMDMGKASKEKLDKWKTINRKPSYMYYPNSDKNKMWSHIGHLQSNNMYGSNIKFFGYNNGEYIFWETKNSKGYLTPNSPVSEYK